MNHIALYRSWRPQHFHEIVGQGAIVQTLQNALRENKFSHAYLFNGPRGTGKTSAAKLLARALNCEGGPAAEPCNRCSACARIAEGSVMDVLEIDAASNRGVDEIRDIRDKVKYAPTEVRFKVYIIDEVHMLTTEAFNALLKTLEEPPAHVVFILATTEPNRLPATIISRCQRFDFRRVPLQDQIDRIRHICTAEKMEIEEAAIQYIARLSDGGMRDALSLLDQAGAYAEAEIRYTDVVSITGGLHAEQFRGLAEAVADNRVGDLLRLADTMLQEGKSVDKCMENLIQYFRDLLVVQSVPNPAELTDRLLEPEQFRDLAGRFARSQLFTIMDVLNRYHGDMKYASHPNILFEIALMKIAGSSSEAVAQPEASPDSALLNKLLERIEKLEKNAAAPRAAPVAGAASSSSRSVPVSPTPPAAASSGAGGGPAAVRPAAVSSSQGSSPRTGMMNLESFFNARSTREFQEIAGQWARILQVVKEKRITVHAWLVDGEPVSSAEGAVLVAFKNAIHRETTEKPANRQLIESVLEEVTAKPLRLITIMQKEWKEYQPEAVEGESREVLELQPETSAPKEEWIAEAVRLFGEDLVKIQEE